MARITFEWDPDFDDNLKRASNKSRSSLRGLEDKVRQVTDAIYFKAKDRIAAEAGKAEDDVQVAKSASNRFSRTGKLRYARAKAIAFALKSANSSIVPTMEYDGDEIFGRVTINRKGSASLEFGGLDPVAEVGRGTGEYVEHPPFAFLRRAMDSL